jgi:hypothetical protein
MDVNNKNSFSSFFLRSKIKFYGRLSQVRSPQKRTFLKDKEAAKKCIPTHPNTKVLENKCKTKLSELMWVWDLINRKQLCRSIDP